MDKLRKELSVVSKTLSNLAQKVEKIQKKVDEQARRLKIPKYQPTKKKAMKKIPAKKTVVKKTAPPTAADKIYSFIKKSKKGIKTSDLMKKTGYDRKPVSSAIYKLTKQRKIKTVAKGTYVKTSF